MRPPRPAQVLLGSAWTLLAVLVAAGFLRVLAPDRSRWLVLLATVTPVLYLPAWLVAAGAAVARRWHLLAAALLVVAVHVWWTAALFEGARGPLPQPTASALLLAVNLNADRSTGPAAARVIEELHPDLVVVSEASPTSTTGLDVNEFPVHVSDVRAATNGWLVLSKWPLLDQRTVDIGGRTMPRLVLRRPDGGRLVLWQVHPVAPVAGHVREWRRQLEAVRAAVSVDQHGPDPVVVAGDFNATRDLPELHDILDDGWVDAADGHGLLPTWPAGAHLPPLLRLDHVLLSPGVGVDEISRTPDIGSDHLGVVARLDFG